MYLSLFFIITWTLQFFSTTKFVYLSTSGHWRKPNVINLCLIYCSNTCFRDVLGDINCEDHNVFIKRIPWMKRSGLISLWTWYRHRHERTVYCGHLIDLFTLWSNYSSSRLIIKCYLTCCSSLCRCCILLYFNALSSSEWDTLQSINLAKNCLTSISVFRLCFFLFHFVFETILCYKRFTLNSFRNHIATMFGFILVLIWFCLIFTLSLKLRCGNQKCVRFLFVCQKRLNTLWHIKRWWRGMGKWTRKISYFGQKL